MPRTTDGDVGYFKEPIDFVESLQKIYVVPAVEAAHARVGGEGQITEHQQRSDSQGYAASGMSGRMIDLEPIAGTEREPLALQRCAIGHRDRLSVQFQSSAVGQFECGRFRHRA